MAQSWTEFMGREPYDLQIPAGEAVARWLKREHPHNTAKAVGRKADLDPRTVENILNGHLSGSTLTKLLRAYGWSLLATAGAEVIGESFEQALHREIEEIARDREDLERREGELRGLYARTRARRALAGGHLRLVPEEDRHSHSEMGR